MTTTCSNCEALDFRDSDPATFKICSFLVNVLSHMYEQWVKSGSPLDFDWQPVNACEITNDFKVSDYEFITLIWSTFTYENALGAKKTVTEPFGSIVKSTVDGNLFLVFRGSKSAADFLVDVETSPVSYLAKTLNPPPGIQVGKGWYSVYSGLRESLLASFQSMRGENKLLTITGHSLGSALATLAVPDAVANSLRVRHYNSASPMVGLLSFKAYYESLKAIDSTSPGWQKTFRLVNAADSVPKFPESPAGYVHVGTSVAFNADYGSEKKIHDPCCSYAYAIYNPEHPCNPDFDQCATGAVK